MIADTASAQDRRPAYPSPEGKDSGTGSHTEIIPSGIEGVRLTGNGLLSRKTEWSAAEFHEVFRSALLLYNSSRWLLGDILLLGERQWGARCTASPYKEAMQMSGASRSVLRGLVLTCQRFPLESRLAELSFSHHQEVAKADATPSQREEALRQAADNKLSCSSLRKQLQSAQAGHPAMSEAQLKGEEPDRRGLLNLPERVTLGAPPMWDALKFRQWTKKQDTDRYSIEQCAQAIRLCEDIAAFYRHACLQLKKLRQGDETNAAAGPNPLC